MHSVPEDSYGEGAYAADDDDRIAGDGDMI